MKPIGDHIDVLLGDLAAAAAEPTEAPAILPFVGGPDEACCEVAGDDDDEDDDEDDEDIVVARVLQVAWLAGYDAAMSNVRAAQEKAWVPACVDPDVKPGDYREFVVEVKSEYSDKTFVTSAVYLNEFEVDDWQEYGPEKRSGWHSQGPSPEYEDYLIPLKNVVRWRELPKPPAGLDSAPAPAGSPPAAPSLGGRAAVEEEGVVVS